MWKLFIGSKMNYESLERSTLSPALHLEDGPEYVELFKATSASEGQHETKRRTFNWDGLRRSHGMGEL